MALKIENRILSFTLKARKRCFLNQLLTVSGGFLHEHSILCVSQQEKIMHLFI